MRKLLLAAILCFCCVAGFSQAELIIQSNEKGMYINHVVTPKENFYSLGRLYAISPRDIAAFNALDMNNGLNIGQTVKIPLNITNFSQSTQVGAPVYYIVGEKEGLYRISTKNNKVLMENLRKWNNLKSDAVAAGQKLVVGYLVSVPSSGSVASTTNEPKAPQPQQKATAVGERKTDANPQAAVTASRTSPSTTASRGAQANAGSGYFKGQYDSQTKKTAAAKDQTATAGIFKTASGWQDGKYYALIDNVEPGTIIRVVNPSNNKAVFAKVLGEMSGIRQNEGLEVRISNAAASALDIAEQDKFIVRINY